jgi:hypothetical protein
MNWLTALLVPIAVSATFAFARKYLTASSMRPPVGENLLIPFGGTSGVNICIIAVGVVFAASTYALLAWLSRLIATMEGPAEIWLWPQSAIWWFFPLFGAITLSWEIVLQLWSTFGNREAAYAYNYGWAQTAGFDSTRMLRWMGVFIALPIGIVTILALPMHVALGKDEIRDCGYAFSGCEVYGYVDARRMTAIEGSRNRYGMLVRRAGIVINFSDGQRWSSGDIGDFRDSIDPQLAEFLESKTHLPLNQAVTEADIPAFVAEPKPETH